jgi:queuine tRNA-ribosyltransferase
MPVGTQATVKTLTPSDLVSVGARCVLANTYHLALRPGTTDVAKLGGLHRFMGWNGPILTDSGGFQVFSLTHLRATSERGVRFRSHLDGRGLDLTPESVVEAQARLGSDIAMPLDVCLGAQASSSETVEALERTRRWALRSQAAHRRADQLLFGIVQGGLDAGLRREAARDLGTLQFPGYAIGGLSVGEPVELTDTLVDATASALPANRARYLMGVGTPEQVIRYVASGVDLFDCVLPTRFGRTGLAFGAGARLNLRKANFARDPAPIDESCDCPTCGRFSRAQLHDLARRTSPLGARLISLHNTRALTRTAERARRAILDGRFAAWLAQAPARSRRTSQPADAARTAGWHRGAVAPGS